MKKLSEQLLEGSQRIAAWENQRAAIREQNQREYEAPVAEAQARVRSSHTAFAARILEETDAWRLVDVPSDGMVGVPVSAPASRAAELAN